MTTQTEALKLALEALETSARNWPSDSIIEAITAIKEALSSPNGEAQQEVYSNYCFQCESLSRELAALKAQQPQNEVRGLSHSNEQVEPARSEAYAMIDKFLGNNLNSDADYAEYSKALDLLYLHPPVPTAQPKEPEQEPIQHCEAGPEYCWKCYEEIKPTYGSEEIRKLRDVIASQAKIIEDHILDAKKMVEPSTERNET